MELSKLDFSLTDSKTNFVFAKHNRISGAEIYEKLRENGILVRHFNGERIKDYNRITIGTKEEMSTFINVIKRITEG